MSQRWLSTDELKQFDDVFGFAIAVRVRLSNDGSVPVYYLADAYRSIKPQGYELFRNVGESTWNYSPPIRGRGGSPGMEPVNSQYTYLILPADASIEVEMFDWSRSGQEHAFSAFVRFDLKAQPIEIISNTFRPLSK